MNLHGIVTPAINAINPFVTVRFRRSTGYTTQSDGKRVPQYAPAITLSVQRQALQFQDIQQLDGLNIQGVRSKVYLAGDAAGIVRASKSGGDLMQFEDGTIWLVAVSLEDWPDWCSVAITQQMRA